MSFEILGLLLLNKCKPRKGSIRIKILCGNHLNRINFPSLSKLYIPNCILYFVIMRLFLHLLITDIVPLINNSNIH